jgi:PAS domain S-box-containing protein
VLAILPAIALAIVSGLVYRGIDQNPDASSLIRGLGYILPVAAIANLILLFVIARLAAGSATDLQDSNERLRSVIDSAVDGIIVIDDSARIEAFNRGAERLFGYPASEVIGQNVNVLMPAPYHEEHDGYLSRYLATGSAHIIGIGREVSGRRRDGTIFPLHLSVGEMTVGGSQCARESRAAAAIERGPLACRRRIGSRWDRRDRCTRSG